MSGDHEDNSRGAWIFLSHSHKDLERVREIRNTLERLGHNPLLFFLKCLESDESELPELLRREISARNWFVLCDSEHSQSSRWVQEEVKLIKSLPGKVFETIHLSADLEPQLHKLISLSKRATIYISYARTDTKVARTISEELAKTDYRVFFDITSLQLGQNWAATISSAIDDAVNNGFVLLLLSPDALTSEFCKNEVDYALHKSKKSQVSNIVPVIVRDAEAVFSMLPDDLAQLYCFDLTAGNVPDRIHQLIADLKSREME